MQCPNPSCAQDIRPGWKHCPKCRTAIPQKRACNCGEELDPDWSICPVCGSEDGTAQVARVHDVSFVCCVSGKPVIGKDYFVCQECGEPCLEEYRAAHPYGEVLAFCSLCAKPLLATLWERKQSEELANRKQQEEEARRQGVPGENWSCDLDGGVPLEMVWVPAGEFMMGSYMMGSRTNDSERPIHHIRIDNGFWLGKYPVTQAQYEAMKGAHPNRFSGADRPVEQVSWEEAQDFIRRLNSKLSLGGPEFRLPTEAEWEYSCRAGGSGLWWFGGDGGRLPHYAWYNVNSNGETQPVGRKEPNACGLYDMYGNVWEWCEDEWHDNYEGAPSDGRAWLGGDGGGVRRVCRGGAWACDGGLCRSASRLWRLQSNRFDYLGFRLLRAASRSRSEYGVPQTCLQSGDQPGLPGLPAMPDVPKNELESRDTEKEVSRLEYESIKDRRASSRDELEVLRQRRELSDLFDQTIADIQRLIDEDQ